MSGKTADQLQNTIDQREPTMARLVYSMATSLDGYAVDADGNFDWSEPDEEVHAFVNDLYRSAGTYLYGRRMYETMVFWETAHTQPDQPDFIHEYARVWQAAEKIVYSRTRSEVSSARTRIERSFDPDAIRSLKSAADRDLTVAGPGLAASALRAGLVDEIHQLVSPIVVGGGTRFLPDDVRIGLDLLDERRFTNGAVFLRYAARH